jgi:hypothetical protein
MPRKNKEERWVSAREATRILEEKAGRPIARNYIGILVKLGKVEARPVDGRTNEYRASDLENYVIKPRSKPKEEKAEAEQNSSANATI